MALGNSFSNLSLDLAISKVPRSQGSSAAETLRGAKAELRQQWEALLKQLPDRILSTTGFQGFAQHFRNVLCESSLEILCRDLIGVAQSASTWEECLGRVAALWRSSLAMGLGPSPQ